MKVFRLLLRLEKATIIRGLIISSLVILPFAFLPAIIESGLSVDTLIGNFGIAASCSIILSVIVIIAAIAQNHETMTDQLEHFQMPAFQSLGFEMAATGIGSIVDDLEFIIIGKVEFYFFRLNLRFVKNEEPKVEIVPLITLVDMEDKIDTLVRRYEFEHDISLRKSILLKEIDLESDDGVRTHLVRYSKIIYDMGFVPLEKSTGKF